MPWQVGQPWNTPIAGATCPPPDCEDQLTVVGSRFSATELEQPDHFDYAAGLCYVAAEVSDSITIVDVTDPTNPTIVDSFTHLQLGRVRNMYYDAADEICYCTGGDNSGNYYLNSVDVSTPTSMSIIGTLVDTFPSDVLGSGRGDPIRSGDLLYIPMLGGLTIVDVSDPTNPTLIGHEDVDTSGGADGSCRAAVKLGNLVYVVTDGGDLVVFDVTTPSAPTYETALSFENITSASSFRGLVYDSGLFYTAGAGDFFVIDMTPTPTVVGSILSSSALLDASGIAKDGDLVYVGAVDGIIVVDVSTPSSPVIVDSVLEPSLMLSTGQLAFNGTTIYATSVSADRLNVIQPVCVDVLVEFAGSVTHTNTPYNALVADGIYVYGVRGTQDRIGVVDVSDPTTPVLVGNHTDTDTDLPVDIAKQGSLVYVVAFNNDSLTVFDVSDPTNPTNAGTITHATNLDAARYVDVYGNFAYVAADGSNRFTIVNVSNPASMSIEASITDATLLASGPVVRIGSHVYMANTSQAVVAIDVSDPTDPQIVDSITSATVAAARGIAAGASGVLLVATTTLLITIDIDDPTNIGILDTVAIPSGAEVVYSGGYAVVSSTGGAVYVVDVSNPSDIEVVDSIVDPSLFGTATALAMSDCVLTMGGFIGTTTYIFAFNTFFGGGTGSSGWSL